MFQVPRRMVKGSLPPNEPAPPPPPPPPLEGQTDSDWIVPRPNLPVSRGIHRQVPDSMPATQTGFPWHQPDPHVGGSPPSEGHGLLCSSRLICQRGAILTTRSHVHVNTMSIEALVFRLYFCRTLVFVGPEVMQITEVLRQCDRIRTIVWGGVGQDTTKGMIPGNPVLCLS